MPLVPALLKTPRLELRRWSLDDLDDVMAAIEASIESLQPWMPWAAGGVPSREIEQRAFQTGIANFDADIDWPFSLYEIDSGACVGGCGLHRTKTPHQVEIGYWIHADHQSRGYATEATSALVDVALTAMDWVEEVRIRMDVANTGSARVPAKLGFQMIAEEERPVKRAEALCGRCTAADGVPRSSG